MVNNMQEISIHKLIEQANQEKRNKNYDLERKLLFTALEKSPDNIKILNRILRNLRKTGTPEEQKNILERIYQKRKDGKILHELISLELRAGNQTQALEYLKEKQRIEPKNKKISKKISSMIKSEKKSNPKDDEEDIEYIDSDTINKVRPIIYSEKAYEEKKNEIVDLLVEEDETVSLALITELYYVEIGKEFTKKHLKEIKNSIEDNPRMLKVINQLLELVTSKKTRQFDWNEFWSNMRKLKKINEESDKIIIKKYLQK